MFIKQIGTWHQLHIPSCGKIFIYLIDSIVIIPRQRNKFHVHAMITILEKGRLGIGNWGFFPSLCMVCNTVSWKRYKPVNWAYDGFNQSMKSKLGMGIISIVTLQKHKEEEEKKRQEIWNNSEGRWVSKCCSNRHQLLHLCVFCDLKHKPLSFQNSI